MNSSVLRRGDVDNNKCTKFLYIAQAWRYRKSRLMDARVGLTPCGRELFSIAWGYAGASAYLIGREGSHMIINAAMCLDMTMDSLLFHMIGSPVARHLRPLVVNPATSSGESSACSSSCRG